MRHDLIQNLGKIRLGEDLNPFIYYISLLKYQKGDSKLLSTCISRFPIKRLKHN